jgi:protein transport protein SEC23
LLAPHALIRSGGGGGGGVGGGGGGGGGEEQPAACPGCADHDEPIPDRILLLDTYFNVVVFHGETVAEWKRQNYHENPEYASFKQLLEAPQEEAKELMRERFPYPRFVDCNQHGSQARFLLSKVNPSSTHNQMQGGGGGEIIQTDDVSFQTFLEYLQRLTVQS